MPKLRSIRYGEERLPAGHHHPRHQHFEAYATVLLEGCFEQVGYAGRCIVEPGDILIQPTLDCHGSRMLSAGIRLLRLPWNRDASFGGVYRGLDVDSVRGAAGHSINIAAQWLRHLVCGARTSSGILADWEDLLVQGLTINPSLKVQEWADQMQLARETVSRGFRRCYGVSPCSFRSEMRTREAWLRITGTAEALCTIAVDTGFADQSHMTRAVKTLTGKTPAAWRQMPSAAGATVNELRPASC
jgi:AraC-like DNA-binding protein